MCGRAFFTTLGRSRSLSARSRSLSAMSWSLRAGSMRSLRSGQVIECMLLLLLLLMLLLLHESRDFTRSRTKSSQSDIFMKNVQIPLMIFILSLLLLSLSQSILQTVSPTNYSLHFKHTRTHSHVQSHINIANMPNHRLTQRYWGAASNSDTRVETSDVEFNSVKLTIMYRMLQF